MITSKNLCVKDKNGAVGPNRPIGESWGMANDGEWRTPHFQQKWKRGHNENSLWQ